jgi:hypothetical protein
MDGRIFHVGSIDLDVPGLDESTAGTRCPDGGSLTINSYYSDIAFGDKG